MDFGKTLLRTVVGGLFIGHGTQKLFGWFGGHGPEGTGDFFDSLGLRPGRRQALAAGAAEAGGGALLALGFLTPLAAAALTGTMATAIRKVHGPKGPWVTDGGYEYNLVLATVALALTADGPGRPSVDAALWPGLEGPGLALLAVGGGVGAAYALTSDRLADFSMPRQEDQITFGVEHAPVNGSLSEPALGRS
jgi:putative oxidoreductase